MGNPIRILHVFSIMDFGGAETMIMDIYRKINRNEVQFDFVVHTEKTGIYDEEILSLGGKIYRVPEYRGLNHFSYIKAWNNLLIDRNKKIDIIHGHVRSTASLYLSIAKKSKIPTIAHSHSTSNGSGFSSLVKKIYQIPIRYIADYYFSASMDAAIWLFGNNIIKNKNLYIIKNSIDVRKYEINSDIRNKYRKDFNIEDKLVVGHIGSFKEAKNHIFLLEVFKEINELHPNSVLVLVGDGDLKDNIISKISELGIENKVKLTGVRKDIPEVLFAMDLFVFPSLFEGFGIVAIESQAAGLPTFVSNKIPNEVFLTNLIKPLSLENDPAYWAGFILDNLDEMNRESRIKEIETAGYDIYSSTEYITDLYKKIGRQK